MRQVWEYEDTLSGKLYSPALGDADPQPTTGNVLADFGFVTGEGGIVNPEVGRGLRSIRIIEVDPDAPDDPPMDVRLSTDVDVVPMGTTTYRVERLPSLYPPGIEVLESESSAPVTRR